MEAADTACVNHTLHSPVLCSGSPELHGSLEALTVLHMVLTDVKWGQTQDCVAALIPALCYIRSEPTPVF